MTCFQMTNIREDKCLFLLLFLNGHKVAEEVNAQTGSSCPTISGSQASVFKKCSRWHSFSRCYVFGL